MEENHALRREKLIAMTAITVGAALPIVALLFGLINQRHGITLDGPFPDMWPPGLVRTVLVMLALVEALAVIALVRLRLHREARHPESSKTVKLTQRPVAAACPFCKSDLERADLGDGVIRCAACEVAHH